MSIFVIHTYLTDGEMKPSLVGPFPSHVAANAFMQRQYDAFKSDENDGDDSDGSHFYVEGQLGVHHWMIVQSVTPSGPKTVSADAPSGGEA